MDSRNPDLDVALARAGWPAVLYDLLSGVVHDLNGRATTLGGLAQLFAMGDDPGELIPELDQEVKRLIGTLRWLEILATSRSAGDGAGVSLAEVMPELVELQKRHRRFRRVPYHLDAAPAGTLPAVDRGLMVPVLLLLLSAVGEEALRRSGDVRIHVGSGGEDGQAALRAEIAGEALEDSPETSLGERLDRLRPLAARAGGRLDWTLGPTAPQVELVMVET